MMQSRIKHSHRGFQTCILSTTSHCSKGWSLRLEVYLRDKRKQLTGQTSAERARCYGGQERIEFQDGATGKQFQILQRDEEENGGSPPNLGSRGLLGPVMAGGLCW